MVAAGLLNEVGSLFWSVAMSEKLKPLQSLGYKQVIEFLEVSMIGKRCI